MEIITHDKVKCILITAQTEERNGGKLSWLVQVRLQLESELE